MQARHGRSIRGFSLIDLLVSMAVMAVLISLLLPSLMKVQESARRVRCMGHMQQIGYAVTMYADQWLEHLPPAGNTVYRDEPVIRFPGSRRPVSGEPATPEWQADTMLARTAFHTQSISPPPSRGAAEHTHRWEGLGVLYPEYLSHPEVCYCPSHHGEHPIDRYLETWRTPRGDIFTNFQYRVPGISPFRKDLDPRTTILTDGMLTKSDYNHVHGSNTLKVDGSVGWFEDTGGRLFSSLPDDVILNSPSSPNPDRHNPDRTPLWREIDQRGAQARPRP